jgi:acyl carrier protein
MTQEQLLLIITQQLGKRRVNMGDDFQDDLGASSLDMVHIMAVVEEQFGVFVPEEMIPEMHTPQDLFQYIKRTNEATNA